MDSIKTTERRILYAGGDARVTVREVLEHPGCVALIMQDVDTGMASEPDDDSCSWMSPDDARRVARALLALADEIDEVTP